MSINLNKAKEAFASYVSHYNPDNGMVRLKIVHTYKVVEVAKEIAEELHVSEEDSGLAQLIALLHDIGRFEQIRRYGDFRDHLTVDHAKLGADLLEEGLLKDFIDDRQYDDIILKAIRMHNRYCIDETLDERTLLHAKIIRDADKTDIFRVRVEDDIRDIQSFTKEELEDSLVSDEVYKTFLSHQCINRKTVVTPADSWIAGAAMIFDYNFKPGLAILKREKRIDGMMQRVHYTNPDTREKMEQVRNSANAWIESRL